ncbi:MAG: TetR/AcrR family transcriptional regulator [Acidimicrobiia bacterium]|nr:TetR/AcrR family transcriptional regulator [Acidimicrobiia bacterium]
MPVQTQMQRTKADTRAVILDAAERVFLEHGWRAAGMREVADGAGLAPSSLYNHFPSKKELFAAVISRRASELQEDALQGFLRGRNFPEDLEYVVGMMRRLARDHAEFVRLAIIDLVEFGAAHITGLDLDLVPVIEALFRPHFERDVEAGLLRDFDLMVVVRFVYLALFGYFGIAQLYGNQFPALVDIEYENREIARLLERGILASHTADTKEKS